MEACILQQSQNFCTLILLSVSSPAFESPVRAVDLFVPGVSSNLLKQR
jgi:hypothetical protein